MTTQPDYHYSNVTDQVNAILEKHASPAGLLAVVASSDQKFLSFSAGIADIPEDKPILHSHSFGIGSITKVFIATVILQLVEEGKLALSDRVDLYLTSKVLRDIDRAGNATVHQLLGHTAGIDSWEDDPHWIVHGRGRLVQPAYVWTKTEPLDYIRRPRSTAPSAAESEIRQRILQPLQLNNTYLEGFEQKLSDEELPCRYHLATPVFRETAGVCPAFPEVKKDVIGAKDYNMSTSWLAGGMISNAADLVKFALAVRDSVLLRPSSMAVMQQWKSAAQDLECGHGLFRMNRAGSGRWIGHSGGVLGFSSGLWWHEDLDCVICVLGNVGTVHTGGVTQGVKAVVTTSESPSLALQLVKQE